MKLAAVVATFALLLTGCLGDGPQAEPPSAPREARPEAAADAEATGGGRPEAAEPATTPDAPRPNREPVATLNADNFSGIAPLSVVFTVEASDPDGDALSWQLDADGDGTAEAEGNTLPARFVSTFEASGYFLAELKVSDGAIGSNSTFGIEVFEAPRLPDPIVFAGQVIGVWLPDGTYTMDKTHTFNLTGALGVVERFNITVVNTTERTFVDFELYAPDGTQVARRAFFNDTKDDPANATLPSYAPVEVNDPALVALPGEWRIVVSPALAAPESGYEATVGFA